MKIVNNDKENLNMFPTPWGISIKFSEKLSLMMVLKVTKIKGFTHLLENAVLEQQQRRGWGGGDRTEYLTPRHLTVKFNLLRWSIVSVTWLTNEKC